MNEDATPSRLVFVVEDDGDVARLILRALEEFGMRTQWFRTGASLLRRLQVEQPDVCVVDLGLPDMDGMELVRRIAERGESALVVVSGRDHPIDRVMGLEEGADDYVVKPFEPRELVARVRSVLRRSTGFRAADNKRSARFGTWTFRVGTHQLVGADGQEVTLSTAESMVLQGLLERPNQILTRDQLIGTRDLSPLDRSIDVRISRLRKKLEVDAQRPRLIKTVYGAGYMLCASVVWS